MSNTVLPFPSSLGEALASADAATSNPDVARARASITVGQALEAEQRAALERSIAGHFPKTTALLADAPRSRVLEPDADGHFPWCAPGKCTEFTHGTGDTTTEHVGAKLEMPAPQGLRASLSAELYENSEYGGPSLSLACAGEGVPLDAAAADRVIEDLGVFLEGLRALRVQMDPEPPAGPRAGVCSGLGGTCETDHAAPLCSSENSRCRGREVAMPDLYGFDFPTAALMHWHDESVPHLDLGQDTPELDLAGVDQLLADLRQYTAGIAALRSQLARLTGGAR